MSVSEVNLDFAELKNEMTLPREPVYENHVLASTEQEENVEPLHRIT
jgi:hypothetical protein